MKNKKNLSFVILLSLVTLFHFQASAGVVLLGNRIIYLGSEKEKSLQFSTNDNFPTFVEAWAEESVDASNPAVSKAPFIVTPQSFRMAPKSQQYVKLIYTGARALPQDRESVFYFNFLQVPAVGKDTRSHSNLFYRVNSKVKLFYRPATLPKHSQELGKQLVVSVNRSEKISSLVFTNPTPYFVTLTAIKTANGQSLLKKQDSLMIAPFERTSITLNAAQLAQLKSARVALSYINDFGNTLHASHQL